MLISNLTRKFLNSLARPHRWNIPAQAKRLTIAQTMLQVVSGWVSAEKKINNLFSISIGV
jgi:hypothetical protein